MTKNSTGEHIGKNISVPVIGNRISFSYKTYEIAVIALFSAMLTGVKLALAVLPNIELVTVFILVFSAVFGLKYATPAVTVFCTVEMFLYGIGSWVILYFFYWNMLALFGATFLKKAKFPVVLTVAMLCTLFFGVLSSVIDAVIGTLGTKNSSDFKHFFVLYYVRGLRFYIYHLISTFASVLITYLPLTRACKIIKVKLEAKRL